MLLSSKFGLDRSIFGSCPDGLRVYLCCVRQKQHKIGYFYYALLLGVLIHGLGLLVSYDKTYDGFVHMFFADHYMMSWWETWEPRWYTGFHVTSYPPLVHQIVALLGHVMSLPFAFMLYSIVMVCLLIRGVYVYSRLLVCPQTALIAAVLAPLTPSIVEALHVFGQVPSLTGVCFLLNALPEIYHWIKDRSFASLFRGLSFLTIACSAHHVTIIFGTVFFIFPVIFMGFMDHLDDKGKDGFRLNVLYLYRQLKAPIIRAITLGCCIIFLVVLFVFPYWYWSITDPITQVPIPHGSRHDFLAEPSSGLVFFLIPWGVMLLSLPFILQMGLKRRNLVWLGSLIICLILGTGGTTAIPITLLGENAFNILTLDRFTFWATILSIPMWALFAQKLYLGEWRDAIIARAGLVWHRILAGGHAVLTLASCIVIMHLTQFNPIQPDRIDIDPIVKFLDRDGHSEWRYMTLGFGDQMAWLSANTNAKTIDGNYHSARRLKSLTSHAVERLENSKYRGQEGLSALRDILAKAKKHNLKYIFSNDRFYDPVLQFHGWDKLPGLENGINIWERPNIPKLDRLEATPSLPRYQRLMWGALPLSSIFLCLLIHMITRRRKARLVIFQVLHKSVATRWLPLHIGWLGIGTILIGVLVYISVKKPNAHSSPEALMRQYFQYVDYKEFRQAYKLFDPETRPKLDQYLLELSIEDGLLNSFAKLDSLDISISPNDDSRIAVHSHWNTSVRAYSHKTEHPVVHRDDGWYLQYPKVSQKRAASRIHHQAMIDYHAQGRRQPNVDHTSYEDILDRPQLKVGKFRIVAKDGQTHLVGNIYNVDATPASLYVQILVRDQSGRLLHTYDIGSLMRHRLLPGDQTPFRIVLEDIPIEEAAQYTYTCLIESTVSTYYEYPSVQVSTTCPLDCPLDIVNTGSKPIRLAQVLSTHADLEGILWLEEQYLKDGIKPQKSQAMNREEIALEDLEVLYEVPNELILANGKLAVPRAFSAGVEDLPIVNSFLADEE